MAIKNITELHTWLSNMLLQKYITKADLKEVIDNFNWDSSIPIEALVKPKIAGIQWESRYSTTLKDDERGRWMRIGRINGMTVAIILKAKERFLIKLPNNSGDESLQSHIIATDLGQGMLEAEKYIAKYVSNFSV